MTTNRDVHSARLTILTGPPSDPALDVAYVAKFRRAPGAKVICGGTTANIVSRVLGRRIEPLLDPGQPSPPWVRLSGVGPVTEGVITLERVLDLLGDGHEGGEPAGDEGAAGEIVRALREADTVVLMVGDAINPTRLRDVERGRSQRQVLIEALAEELRRRGKTVEVEHY
ncbi:MAG: hypothetical protein ACYC1C_09325 [Chloroflexota bacterium]